MPYSQDMKEAGIPGEKYQPCQSRQCNGLTTKHTFHEYLDLRYLTCTRCGAHTTEVPDAAAHRMVEVARREEDRTRAYADFKRNNPRQYRGKNWRKRNGEDG